MSKIDRKTVKRVAHLARIGMESEELERFSAELVKILAFVEELQSVDTDGVEPVAHVTGLLNVSRDDAEEEALPAQNHDLLEEQAPGHIGKGEIRVPRIIL